MKIPLVSIDPPVEVRASEDIARMAGSFDEQGQLHGITVRETNGSYQVITGFTRYFAAVKLGWAEIDAEIRQNVSDEQVRELQLHENLKRNNIPWYDLVIYEKELHELRQAQHGSAESRRPRRGEKKGWGLRDTAVELGRALGPLSEDFLLADAVKADPRLRNIKERKTALRLVRVRARQATAEAEALSTPEDGTSFNQVYLGAAEAILAQLPDTTFDVCITDPPWLVFKDENLTHDVETLPVFKELYRVMKFPSFLLMFVGIDDLIFYRRELPRIGWAVSKVPAIWHKPGVQTMGDDSWQYSRDFEFILVAAKGKPAFTFSKQKSALFSFPPVPPPKMIHPNEKPMGLLVELLRDTSYEGACFIDPFAGSGCHLHAARTLNRRWVGIERDSASYEKILERLEK